MEQHEFDREMEKLFGTPESKLPQLVGKIIKVPKGGRDVERIVQVFKDEALRDRVRVALAKTQYQKRLDFERDINALARHSIAMATYVAYDATPDEIQALNAGMQSWIVVLQLHEWAVQFKSWCAGEHSEKEWKYVPLLAEEFKEALTDLKALAPLRDVTLKFLLKCTKEDLILREKIDDAMGGLLEIELMLATAFAEVN